MNRNAETSFNKLEQKLLEKKTINICEKLYLIH